MIPLRALASGGIVLAILAALYFTYNAIYDSAVTATNLTHVQELERLRAENTRKLVELKSAFEIEVARVQTENLNLEQALKEFEDETRNLAVPAGCGVPADLLLKLEAIR